MLHRRSAMRPDKNRRPVGDDAVAYQEMVVVQLGWLWQWAVERGCISEVLTEIFDILIIVWIWGIVKKKEESIT